MKTPIKTTNGENLKREISYPAYALDEALKVAEAVRDLGGTRAPVSKSLLAKHLKYAETGPSFFQRVGAAKCYKLISGWGSYSLTKPAQIYFFPTTETDKKIALLAFLRAPTVFDKLVNRFEGSILPSIEMLGNTLHNESNVPASWKDKVAGFFIKSAQVAGALDSSGRLSTSLTGQTDASQATVTPMSDISEQQTEPIRYRRVAPPQVSGPVRTWEFVDGDKVLRVETPSQLSSELWQLLENYVLYLKPRDKKE